MLLQGLFNHTKIPLLKKSLRASAMRQRVRANNIANANTPGYQRLEVRFEEELQKALRGRSLKGTTTNPRHIPVGRPAASRVEPKIYQPNDPSDPSGVNNVDIEYEMAQLAKNQMLYLAAAGFTEKSIAKIKMAIRGRV